MLTTQEEEVALAHTSAHAEVSDDSAMEFLGGNRMFTMCTEHQWRAAEVFIRGLNELIEMRRSQGKSTEIVSIMAEHDAFNPEVRVQSTIVRWREPTSQPSETSE